MAYDRQRQVAFAQTRQSIVRPGYIMSQTLSLRSTGLGDAVNASAGLASPVSIIVVVVERAGPKMLLRRPRGRVG